MIHASTPPQKEKRVSLESISTTWYILSGQSLKRIQEVKKALSLRFDVKDVGELNYFLGVQVRQNHNKSDVWIGQPTFTESILKKYGMEDAKPVKTPVNVNSKLMKATEDSEFVDKGLYCMTTIV